jgi:iron complex outermembrane receptor protein
MLRLIASVLAAAIAAAASFGSAGEPDAAPVVTDQPDVEVRGQALPSAASRAATKSQAEIFDLPFSAQALGRELIEAVQAERLTEVLRIASSAIVVPDEGLLVDAVTLRGFADAAVFRDGFNTALAALPLRDSANIQTIEILKGPISALYGAGEPGGSIHIETKKPQAVPAHEFALEFGSYSRFRTELDLTGPLSAEHGLLYRVVGALEESDGFRDFVKTRREFVAPSLVWEATPRLSLSASAELARHEAPFDRGVAAVDGRLVLPAARYLGEPGDGETQVDGATALFEIDYRLGERWEIGSSVYLQEFDLEGSVSEPDEFLDEDPADPDARLLARELQILDQASDVQVFQTELSGRLRFAGIEHAPLLGVEFSWADDRNVVSGSDADDEPYAIDVFRPVYGQPRPEVELSHDGIEEIEVHSVYAQDQFGIGSSWKGVLGLRYDHIEIDGEELVDGILFHQTDEDLTVRAGLVYQPAAWVSLYASYGESFDPNEGLMPDGRPLRPTRAHSWEAGWKLRDAARNLHLTVAFFRATQRDVARDAPGDPGFEIQVARQKSRGVDVELAARPGGPLEWLASYAYTDAELLDDPEIPDGTAPLNVPRHKATVSVVAGLSLRRARDLRLGAALVYSSRRQGSLEEEEFDFRLPAHLTGDLFAAYRVSERLECRLHVQNVGDADYFLGSQGESQSVSPGVPLTVTGSIRLSF